MSEYLQLIEKRRSNYDLGRNVTATKEQINELIATIVHHNPSSYNSQSTKVIVLYGLEHDDFWDLVSSQLEKIVAPERFPATKKKIEGFKKAYATVLFFEDESITGGLVEKYPTYAQNFQIWAQQANAMVQYGIWVGLGSLALGGSLQHYNEVIEEAVWQTYDLDRSWRLIAQMPFGSIESAPNEKAKKIEGRMIIKE